MIWAAVLLGSLGTFAAKFLGFLLPASALEHPKVRSIAALLPVALLSALVAVQTLVTGNTVGIDARVAAMAVAVVALLLRAPFLVVVFSAAATAALLRALGLMA